MTDVRLQTLIAHPQATAPSPAVAVRGGCRVTARTVRLRFEMALASAVRIDWVGGGQRRDGLWRHTCVEAFFGPTDAPPYVELNVAPAGHWALYAFEDYRLPGPLPPAAPPTVHTAAHGRTVTVDVSVDRCHWPSACATGPLRVGLAVVLEAMDGSLHYHALAHPREVPDFHDARAHWSALGILSAGYGP
jgi:hypothetical protein